METRENDAHAIRAILRDGVIYPVEPLPRGWVEGQELQVLVPELSEDLEDFDEWHRETEALIEELYDLQGFTEFEAAIAESDRQAKCSMRRETSLG